jgi:plastocyanin
MHRKSLLVAALGAALVLSFAAHRAFADAAGGASATDTHVSIDNYAFKAPKVTIPAGGAVVWKNGDDDPHTVTADDGSFDSKGLGLGDTYRHVFAKPGTYPYHCSAHPYMKGVVVVEGHS